MSKSRHYHGESYHVKPGPAVQWYALKRVRVPVTDVANPSGRARPVSEFIRDLQRGAVPTHPAPAVDSRKPCTSGSEKQPKGNVSAPMAYFVGNDST